MGSNRREGKAGKKKKTKDGSAPAPAPAHDSNGGAGIISDARFASIQSDPRFQKVPRNKAKVEIDSRFDRIFTDPRFTSTSAPVDKRGKPRRNNRSENPLKHYYRIEESGEKKDDEEEESEEEVEERKKSVVLAKRGREESETESSGESEASESDEDGSEGLESDATSDTDEDDDDGVVYRLDDEPEAPEDNVPKIEEETHRLAVVDMDWRYVKATDLYMMLSSFLPKSGQILNVAIYPSEFGLERMKEEELHGPVGLFDDEDKKKGDDSFDDENDEDDELDNEKLRAYEKSRLKYYYAVVECDSIATADYLYKACDGVEFERSSNVLDLRFIPDSMEFKHPPRDVAKEAPTNYEGLNFETRALQQSKIHLSWDEDEPERVKSLKRKFNAEQLEELELKEYLASESDSDESESDENEENNAAEDKLDKKQRKLELYRALIESGPSGDASDGDGEEKDDKAQDMEVTFNTDLENISKRILEKKHRAQETVWEAYLREKHEKKKLRRRRSKDSDDEYSDTDQDSVEEPDDFFIEEPSVKKHKKTEGKSSKREKQDQDTKEETEVTKEELELLLADDTITDTDLKGYNLKRKKVKGNDRKNAKNVIEDDEIPPIVDDPRFSSLFTSPDFALDPTEPQFKRSATYARQIALKKQNFTEESAKEGLAPAEPRSNTDKHVKSDDRSSNKNKYELLNEIRSVKMRCHQIKAQSDEKASKKDDSPQSSEKKIKKDKKIRDRDLNSMLWSVKRHTAKKEQTNKKPKRT